MALKINQSLVNKENASQLIAVCPFNAIEEQDGIMSIGAGCRLCKLCVNKGPKGVITWEDEKKQELDKSEWVGIAVFVERRNETVHPVTLELIGKARELTEVTGHPVYAIAIGCGMDDIARELLHYGVDKVFVYDDAALDMFSISPYTSAFYDFIQRVKPSSVLVGATNIGRSLAPRVAARCKTGLTADCTMLKMRENTDLVQIRPAFGGNIMAQIVTSNARPQFCTVRYKVFAALRRSEQAQGEIVCMNVTAKMLKSGTEVLDAVKKPAEIDISEAEVIVAVGRGLKSANDMNMIQELAELLGARIAGTRPMIEAGWLDPKRQIGLSGRTVKPRLIIAIGISGAVQFTAGMKGADCIVAINSDENASIFEVAHYGLVGDLYEIVPLLIAGIKEGKYVL
ncbi:MAG: Acryloyl-CoA reductase electron transfer subunit beta [Firmicutes bacterium ADurb.Bin182]|nr:MAG: Acryloyl-CoA reductase electron transfer subunit beta [Firmicutes bacterium ADurb.Bin182]